MFHSKVQQIHPPGSKETVIKASRNKDQGPKWEGDIPEQKITSSRSSIWSNFDSISVLFCLVISWNKKEEGQGNKDTKLKGPRGVEGKGQSRARNACRSFTVCWQKVQRGAGDSQGSIFSFAVSWQRANSVPCLPPPLSLTRHDPLFLHNHLLFFCYQQSFVSARLHSNL